ncbi:MAG: glycosyltransferase family 39 protein, partial [Anaerolineae bacterium]|nr:glycosyltransferase family 39 protein [Anaerolineae bacterium]
MTRTHAGLMLICGAALLLRLALLPLLPHPGFADPNYYYHLGEALVQGRGFTLDFIWQYNNPPADIVHPMDYWMPLNGVIVAAGMALFGVNVAAALLPFALLGALLPLVAFAAVKQFDGADSSALFAAAATALLPELLLHSLRTETTIPAALLVGCTILAVGQALRRGRGWALLPAGVGGGLAYLVRSDAALLLP